MAADGFAPSSTPRVIDTTPAVTESKFQSVRGPSAFDRIGLHRLATSSKPTGPVLLFLPGTNMNGTLPLEDPRHWLPLYLAQHGIDVWALDYRTHFIPPDTPQEQLTELAGWTNQLFASDIGAAADYIGNATGRRRIFIAGFSRGAAFAYLFAAEHPQQVAGLIILDGFILTPRNYQSLAGKRQAVPYATDIGGRSLTYEKRKALLELVIRDPGAPAPIARYHTARENLEQVVYGSKAFGGRGGLADPIGGYSDAVTLARVLLTYDRYWPAVQDSEALLTPAQSQRLAASKLPVLAFSSTNIAPNWPAQVTRSASATGADPSVVVLKGWGHLDVLCGTHAEQQVYAPTLAWLRQHAAAEPRSAAQPSAARSAPAPRPAPTSQNQSRPRPTQ
jgi:pimeloyl-ACP methyl ester carboxylesterase